MIINDTHIIFYVVAVILGIGMSYFVEILNKKLPNREPIFSKGEKEEKIKINLWLILIIICIYIGIVYKFGLSVETLKYILLVPMLISGLIIDFKLQILPNRLNLTMFEIGIVIVLAYTFINIEIAVDSILGMFAGGGIFLLITLIGGLVAGKEAMGFGDVKLMGALGLFFGLKSIIMITVLAFLLGAIVSILIVIIRFKKKTEYIPFGPFIVVAAIIVLFMPQDLLLNILITIFSLGLNKRNEII